MVFKQRMINEAGVTSPHEQPIEFNDQGGAFAKTPRDASYKAIDSKVKATAGVLDRVVIPSGMLV